MENPKSRKSLIISSQLRKARQMLQFTKSEVAQDVQVSPSDIEKWESGVERPNVKQLETLALLYGREIDYFLRESPAPTLEIEFRGEPRKSLTDLSKETRVVIGRFEELCRTALELDELLNKKREVTLPHFKESDSPDVVAKTLRRVFGVDIKPIPRLRNFLENAGALIFELPVPNDEFSGLASWYSKNIPAILLHARDVKGRRNFTLAHELAHLLYEHGSSVCYIPVDFTKSPGNMERIANLVAVNLLLPEEGVVKDFEKKSLSRTPPSQELGRMAGRWGVSIQALGYRLEDLGLINKGHTDQIGEVRPYLKRPKTPQWERQLGKRFVKTALEAYNKGLITSGKLSHALGITLRKTLEEVARRSG